MWKKLTITKVCGNFNELSKYYVWVIPPYGKVGKMKNDKSYVLMNDEKIFVGTLSTRGILFI